MYQRRAAKSQMLLLAECLGIIAPTFIRRGQHVKRQGCELRFPHIKHLKLILLSERLIKERPIFGQRKR